MQSNQERERNTMASKKNAATKLKVAKTVDAEIPETEDGEVGAALAKQTALAKRQKAPPLEEQDFVDPKTGALLSNDEVLKKMAAISEELEILDEADEDDLIEEESDLWKPQKKGEELRGIYLGVKKEGKFKRHFFACKHAKTGEAVMRKVNNNVIIGREMGKVGQGTPTVIRYDGENVATVENEETGENEVRRTNLFTVRFLKTAQK
jgi:hypothetical protein